MTTAAVIALGGVSYGVWSWYSGDSTSSSNEPEIVEMVEIKDIDRVQLIHPTKDRPLRRGIRPPSRRQ